jgi:hypothetical protein
VDEETGKIVAYARWAVPKSKVKEEEKGEQNETEDEHFLPRGYQEGTNVAIIDRLYGELRGMRGKYVDAEKGHCGCFSIFTFMPP